MSVEGPGVPETRPALHGTNTLEGPQVAATNDERRAFFLAVVALRDVLNWERAAKFL